jgi:ATP-dependent RNA helicase DDX55/SPB4
LELIIDSQPSLKDERNVDDEIPASQDLSGRVLPPALLLVSSSDSSPQEDVARFLSEGSPIVVGTPGRIEEFLLKTGLTKVSVKELEMLVLDEADRYEP